jgi:excisionase family DNA binding protein
MNATIAPEATIEQTPEQVVSQLSLGQLTDILLQKMPETDREPAERMFDVLHSALEKADIKGVAPRHVLLAVVTFTSRFLLAIANLPEVSQ